MVYYGIITAAVMMFSVQFFFNREFERSYGSTLRDTLVFSAGSSAAGLIVLLLINGVKLEFTLFSLIMAILTAPVSYTHLTLPTMAVV